MKYYYQLLVCFFVVPISAGNWTREYDKTSQLQFAFAQSQLADFNFQAGEQVLDIGCGTGRTTHFLAKNIPNGSIVGVDSSEDMIVFAQTEYGSHQKNINFQIADAAELPFENEFDRAISFFCLQWLQEKQKAMDGIARALKNNGSAHIFVPVASHDYEMGLNCILAILEQHPEWKPFCTIPNNEQALAWIERAQKSGLTVVKHTIIEKKSTYVSKKEWNTYCAGLGITTLPKEDKNKFLTQVNDLLYHTYGLAENDPYVRTTNILVLKLVKK